MRVAYDAGIHCTVFLLNVCSLGEEAHRRIDLNCRINVHTSHFCAGHKSNLAALWLSMQLYKKDVSI